MVRFGVETEGQQDCLLEPLVHCPCARGGFLGDAERAAVELGESFIHGAADGALR